LAGGTGLALQLGHRVSLDFDLFSIKNTLTATFRTQVIKKLENNKLGVEVRQSIDQTMHLFIGEVAVSLFHYPYKLLETPLKKWHGLSLAGLRDICAMKLSALLNRGSKKDFVDLYVLCKKMGLENVFKTAEEKFPEFKDFSVHAAKALVYFNDAEIEPMPIVLQAITWEQIKRYFEYEVTRYLNQQSH
jgi:predicted nucleotidyltransferase component of viral defense system